MEAAFKRLGKVALVAAACAILITPGARVSAAAPPMPKVDTSGKGAVLCFWMMYELLQETERRCKVPRDAEYSRALEEATVKIDKFILENSSLTPKQLARNRSEMIADQAGHRFCEHGGVDFHEQMRRMGADGVRAIVDDLVSVPREPLMNPCL